MHAKDLPKKERKIFQIVTITSIVVLAIVFFLQYIILAMILGAALLIAQRAYLRFR